ncbi:MAG TPA: alpha/beta fold hydrolase [Polyangiales bacterium]
MSIERTALTTSLPMIGNPLRLRMALRRDPPALIVAPRRVLSDPLLGQLSYLTNASERGARPEPALLLVHAPGVNASAHDLRQLFEGFRDERTTFAPDLPGFGSSTCETDAFTPDLYALAIERMLDLAASQAEGGVDVVAVGLSAEFAAKVAAQRPDVVRSLTLLDPSGFASDRARGAVEVAARDGKTLWPLSLLRRAGLGSLVVEAFRARAALRRPNLLRWKQRHDPRQGAATRPDTRRAALAYLTGSLFPAENPLAIYTRVHCPTLIVSASSARARFQELARFVKWRDHFSALELPHVDLSSDHDGAVIAEAMRAFWDGPGRRSRVC